jgi:hypothetical protein
LFLCGRTSTIQCQSIRNDCEKIAESHHGALRLTETMKMERRQAMLISEPSAASCGRTVLVLNARRKVWPRMKRRRRESEKGLAS